MRYLSSTSVRQTVDNTPGLYHCWNITFDNRWIIYTGVQSCQEISIKEITWKLFLPTSPPDITSSLLLFISFIRPKSKAALPFITVPTMQTREPS
ncbi:hypothetical protein L204_106060 [Cryptococcus depauperatus]